MKTEEELLLSDLIACAKRECAMREGFYPKWIKAGKMTREKAGEELRAMRKIVKILEGMETKQITLL